MSRQLLADLEAAFAARRDAAGKPADELWAEERAHLLKLPATGFVGAQGKAGRDQLARDGPDRRATFSGTSKTQMWILSLKRRRPRF
jgi:hypothetical protein